MNLGLRKMEFIGNVALLLVLYIMQGIPLGFTDILPFIIQSRGANYKDLAMFSLTGWPFSLKIFWAPIIDAIHIKTIGRRKSWIILTQLLIGIVFLHISGNINHILNNIKDHDILVKSTALFTLLTFLSATQDIAVDGWGLNLMPREHLSLVSTCNTVGQTIGYLIGNILFLLLTSPDVLENYFRIKGQLITEENFLYYSGILYILITLLILFFKQEKEIDTEHIPMMKSIQNAYLKLRKFISIRHILEICLLIIPLKFCFAATDSLVNPKIIEAGLTRKEFTLLTIPSFVTQILVSIAASHALRFRSPLTLQMEVLPIKIIFGVVSMGFVYWVQKYSHLNRNKFYYAVLLHSTIHQIISYFQFIPMMNFFALIVDPEYGASQMTLLNTVSNFAYKLPHTLILYLVEYVTFRSCKENTAYSQNDICPVYIDGYYIIALFCTFCGILWWRFLRKRFMKTGLESIKEMSDNLLNKEKSH